MPARNRKGLSENTRLRIKTTMIVKRLQKHIVAKPEIEDGIVINKDLMTQSQVTAALGLIKKTLPDLSAVEHSGEIATNNASELTEAELINRISELHGAGASTGTPEAKAGKKVTH